MDINLLNMDCLEAMRAMKDNSFELAIVDPPYGINAPNMSMGSHPTRKEPGKYPGTSTTKKLKGRLNQGSGKLKNRLLNKSAFDWDNEIPSTEYFKELFRISKNQIIWGGNYFDLPPTRCVICWDKCQPWENFSQWEMAWTSFDKPAPIFHYSNTGGANKEPKIHPTQKPVDLYKWLLTKFAKEGDKVIDTHCGSGSFILACIDLGFEYEAFEINDNYYQDTINRVTTYIGTKGQKLFKPEFQEFKQKQLFT